MEKTKHPKPIHLFVYGIDQSEDTRPKRKPVDSPSCAACRFPLSSAGAISTGRSHLSFCGIQPIGFRGHHMVLVSTVSSAFPLSLVTRKTKSIDTRLRATFINFEEIKMMSLMGPELHRCWCAVFARGSDQVSRDQSFGFGFICSASAISRQKLKYGIK